MAGTGPQPKHPSVRARRNKTTTAATLRPQTGQPDVPPLPERDGGWHPLTLKWWVDVWRSPMAPEYDSSDIHGLYLLAALVDAFWLAPSKDLAAEIRLQRQSFGLSPMDRRRLQWEIERTEEAQDRGAKRRGTQARPPAAGADPRQVLRAVP